MQYTDLQALIRGSSSIRSFFLSLPVSTQIKLHEHNAYIHSAAELYRRTELIEKYDRAVEISENLNRR